MLDDVLDWCETYQVYAVVDFHAATAGQSGIPCDDGVDNGQHLYDDEESMERMFLLMEEFMRRYKDRWIIGAYDCINEPISMTPRREELTPKLVYFYEEMIRRCRKIDQKHLFLLNGTQFSFSIPTVDVDTACLFFHIEIPFFFTIHISYVTRSVILNHTPLRTSFVKSFLLVVSLGIQLRYL